MMAETSAADRFPDLFGTKQLEKMRKVAAPRVTSGYIFIYAKSPDST